MFQPAPWTVPTLLRPRSWCIAASVGLALAAAGACGGSRAAPQAQESGSTEGPARADDGVARGNADGGAAPTGADSGRTGASDAGASAQTVPALDAGAAPAAPYVEPPPVQVYRFHVYAKMKSRAAKHVVLESLVTTSGDTELAEGQAALLERKVEPTPADGNDWLAVADVVVKKVGAKGRIDVEIGTEHGEATVKRRGKTPFSPGQKVRLQVDQQRASTP